MQGEKHYPVKSSNMARLLYSPHLISPAIDFKGPRGSESSFPGNMLDLWDAYFGFSPNATGHVVGSWGAQMKGEDKMWANAVLTYLEKKAMRSFTGLPVRFSLTHT